MRITLTLLTLTLGLQTSLAIDWPQWRGPNRDGVNPEKNLLEKWPEGGPKLLWRAIGVGDGFSSVATSDGVLYPLGDLRYACYLFALDPKGKQLWKGRVGLPGGHRKYPGPRSTPTITGGKVYVLGQQGDLVCFDIKSKKETWRGNLAKDEQVSRRARELGAPMVANNRVGFSYHHFQAGGSIVVADDGTTVAKANEDGVEETVFVSYADLKKI